MRVPDGKKTGLVCTEPVEINGFYFDYEPYYEVAADNETDPDLMMVILSFPMLGFGF